jgi:hypothetical protein
MTKRKAVVLETLATGTDGAYEVNLMETDEVQAKLANLVALIETMGMLGRLVVVRVLTSDQPTTPGGKVLAFQTLPAEV